MGLRTKLTALLLLVGQLGAGLFALISGPFLGDLAKGEVVQNARVMMASAAGARKYTSEEIAPLLEGRMGERFYPQAVSAYAAVRSFEVLHAQFADYSYREPALNPTNLNDRATDWESDIVQQFRAQPSTREIITTRATPAGPVLDFSRPIRAQAACLVCHGAATAAPASMLAVYGPDHGFGWKVGEIIGAQVVSAPMRLAFDRAASIRWLFLAIYLGVFAVLAVVLNLGLGLMVTGPVGAMSRIAEDVSLGNADAQEFQASGADEIARLAKAFTRMRRSLEQALRLLGAPRAP